MKRILITFLFLSFLLNSGWSMMGQEPNYVHDSAESKNLDNFSVTAADAFSPQAKINRIIIAVDISPEGEQYVLTFGNGIKKVEANGVIVDFIPNTSNRLSNAMDFAINSDGKFFVATNESNRRFIRVYSPEGTYLSNETLGDGSYGSSGANQFKGPVGLTFDKDDNLYVADHYIGDANPPPPKPSSIKIYRKDAAGNYKNNLITEFDNVNGTLLNFPYRLAVNSQGQLYMSELGQDNNARARIIELDVNFNPTGIINGPSGNLGAPGSIIIDKFDYIYVADFGNEIDLPRLLAATGDMDEFFAVFEIIRDGIKNDVFNVNVYNPDNSFRSKIPSHIDFPIDLAISSCGTLFVDNAIFDGEITEICLPFIGCATVPNVTMDFDLEAYQRSPGYDTEDPVFTDCPSDVTVQLPDGESTMVVTFPNPVATDNCSFSVTQTSGQASGTQFSEGTYGIEFTVTDASGRTAICEFEVVVNSADVNNPPTFTDCPGDINLNSGSGICGAVAGFSQPNAVDSENDSVTITRIDGGPSSGEIFPVGTTTIIYEANDGVNSPVTCSFDVVVLDIEDPVFTDCPQVVNAQLTAGETTTVVNFNDPVADDNCSGFTVTQTAGPASGTQFTEGTYGIEFTVTDASGRTATCEFDVVVTPADANTPPTFTDCPVDINLNSDSGICGSVAGFSEPNAEDNENDPITITRVDNGPSSGDIFPVGTTTIVYEATDGINPPTICSFDVIIVDSEDPVFTDCPSTINAQLTAGETTTVVNFNDSVADDNCSGYTVTQTAGPASGTQFTEGTYGIEFTVTDASGRTATCEFDVVVTPADANTSPVFTDCPGDINPNSDSGICGAVVSFPDPTAVDNENDPVVITRIDNGPSSGEIFPVGTTTIIYEAYDGVNPPVTCSFDVVVEDNTAPTAICITTVPQFTLVNGSVSIDPSNIDNGSTDNCSIVDFSLSEDTFTSPGIKTVTLYVEDSSGNIGECTTTIEVVEPNTNPESCKSAVINLNASGNAILQPEEVFDGDPEDPSIVSLEVDRDSFSCADIGTPVQVQLTVTYNNSTTATCTSQITIVDNVDPIAKCREFTLYLNEEGYGLLSADILDNGSSDNCGEIEMSLSKTRFENADVGDNTVVLTVTDASGNTDTCESIVTVVPYEEGIGVTCAENITISLQDDGEFELELTYTGNEENIEVVVSQSLFSCDDLGTQVVTATYFGEFTGSCNINITVIDDLPPVVNCVEEINLILDENGNAAISVDDVNLGSTDNCGISRMFLDKSTFTTSDVGRQIVRLTATDFYSNSEYCQVIVNVKPYMATTGDLACVDKLTVELDGNGDAVLTAQDLYAGNPAGVEFFGELNFSCDDIGFHSITLSKKDDPSQSCEVEVEVVDNIDPVALCPPDLEITLNQSGTASLTAQEFGVGSTDNCEIASMSIDRTSFTTADIGLQKVILTVTDASGNISSCEANVTILPNEENPSPVDCVDLFTLPLNANGRAQLQFEDLFSGGTSDGTYSISKDVFTCNDLGENTVTLTYKTSYEEGSCEITVMVEDPEDQCEVPTETGGDYIILYPNPSNGMVRFQTSPGLLILRMEVFDMRGRFLVEKNFESEINTESDYRLDLREYQAGVYSILIYTNGKEYLERAIIEND